MACPRRLVSVTVTVWSADSALAMTTRARAVTAEAEVFTTSRILTEAAALYSSAAERSSARLRASSRETCI